MKVTFITSESTLDHSYTMIKELGKHVELKAYMLAKERTPEIDEYCKKLGVKFVRRLSFKNPLNMFKEILFLKALKNEKPDLVWFNRTTFYQTLLVRLFFKNFIINVHDVVLHPEEKDTHGIITQKLIFRFFKKHIAVMSRTQLEIFRNLYGFTPYLLQLPIIDYYKDISLKPANKNAALDKTRFFFFGSVMPYKGIEKLIEASEILSDKHYNFEVNIFGKLNYNKEELLRKISGNSRINLVNKFIDFKDVSSVFASNDILIIPYIQVSQCGPLLIAYAENTPVICSRLEGFMEYVDDGRSGILFDNTAVSLAEKMKSFIDNPLLVDEMREYIQREIHNRFSMESLAKDYILVFKRAVY